MPDMSKCGMMGRLQRKEASKAVGPHYIKGVKSLLWICPRKGGGAMTIIIHITSVTDVCQIALVVLNLLALVHTVRNGQR